MKQVYPNVIHLANSPADRVAALEDLCRTKVAEVLQAYLNAEADELIRRRPYERTEEGVPVIYRNGHDTERLITTPAGALPSLDRTFHKLWLEGLSQRDFEPALRALLGEAAPLSASTIARATGMSARLSLSIAIVLRALVQSILKQRLRLRVVA